MADTATETAQETTEAAKGAEETVTDGKTTEAGKTDTQAAATTKTEEAQGDKPTVPEKYDLKTPDGSLLPPSALEKISAYAKEKGLSNEAAQELLDRDNQTVADFHEGQLKQVSDIRASWKKAAEVDPEIGGKDFNRNAELSRRVVEHFGDDEFNEIVNNSGLGNHRAWLRIFTRIGKKMGDDQLVNPKANSPAGKKSDQEVFYGSTK